MPDIDIVMSLANNRDEHRSLTAGLIQSAAKDCQVSVLLQCLVSRVSQEASMRTDPGGESLLLDITIEIMESFRAERGGLMWLPAAKELTKNIFPTVLKSGPLLGSRFLQSAEMIAWGGCGLTPEAWCDALHTLDLEKWIREGQPLELRNRLLRSMNPNPNPNSETVS